MGSVVWKSKFQDISTAFPPNWIFRIKQQKVELKMLKLLAFCSLVAMVLADGKCPNENWKYNTTLCQTIVAENSKRPISPHPPGTYCCEKPYDKDIDDLDEANDECFAISDDHVTLALTNGLFYGSESYLCELKPISQ